MLRRCVGLDGAQAELCDLSGRALNTQQVERTLHAFETALAIDLSNNELDQIPATIPRDVIALDVSFNMIVQPIGVEHLSNLQELHLGFNRLIDASLLECCPRLARVNLSGNRLTCIDGLETLRFLENLDLSDNLLESPEGLRALSLNQALTHLALRGNPLSVKTDYRAIILGMIPSVLILDEKKIRSAVKSRAVETSGTKSLSYSRMYDEKKNFLVHSRAHRNPASHPEPILTAHTLLPDKYTGNTVFLESPTSHAMACIAEAVAPTAHHYERPNSPPPAPTPQSARWTCPPQNAVAYMSLYDRLAKANGIDVSPRAATPAAESAASSQAAALHTASKPAINPHLPSEKGHAVSRGKQLSRQSISKRTKDPLSPTSSTTESHVARSCRAGSIHAASTITAPSVCGGSQPGRAASISTVITQTQLDPKQKNVLNVIQSLIEHKKQTLATLARHSAGEKAAAGVLS